MIFGRYCEYDNFSCDGPNCNEGPYLFVDKKNDENIVSEGDVDVPEDSEVPTKAE